MLLVVVGDVGGSGDGGGGGGGGDEMDDIRLGVVSDVEGGKEGR